MKERTLKEDMEYRWTFASPVLAILENLQKSPFVLVLIHFPLAYFGWSEWFSVADIFWAWKVAMAVLCVFSIVGFFTKPGSLEEAQRRSRAREERKVKK